MKRYYWYIYFMTNTTPDIKRLEIWKTIPEGFLFERLCEPLKWVCCKQVKKIITSENNLWELLHWNHRITITCGTHGDGVISSSRNKRWLFLAQEVEVLFFALLLKAADQVGELESVLFPEGDISLWDWMNRYEKEKDRSRRNWTGDHIFLSGNIPTFWGEVESYIKLKKAPHWEQDTYYEVYLDDEKRDIVFHDTTKNLYLSITWIDTIEDYRIWFDEINDYLKTLFAFAKWYGGRTNAGRYIDMLEYIFSPELWENIESERKWREKINQWK